MVRRDYQSPLALAILLGIAWAFLADWPRIAGRLYVQHRLYAVATWKMTGALNHHVLVMAGIFLSIWYVSYLTGWRPRHIHWGENRRWAAVLSPSRPYVAIPLVFLIALNTISECLKVRSGIELRKDPNIVFIMVDTLRPDHMGCYGYSRPTTPNIDKLAAESMRFSKVISQSSWTNASVASIMSGRYLRIRKSDMRFAPPSVPILPEILKDHGYTTAAVVSNPLLLVDGEFRKRFDMFKECSSTESSPRVESTAEKMLRRIGKDRFFLFLLFMDPHGPYTVHDNYQFDSRYTGDLKGLGEVPVPSEPDEWSSDDVEYAKSAYDSEIAFTDEYIGRFIAHLKKLNLYNDTLIVFLSDHGEAFMEHRLMGHGSDLHDELLSVPLIVKLPGRRTGSVVKGTFSLINLMPSILDHLHYNQSYLALQGKGVPLEGLKQVRPSYIYSFLQLGSRSLEAVHVRQLKYIRDIEDGTEQLFDLAQDPQEKRNVVGLSRTRTDVLRWRLVRKVQEIDAAQGNALMPAKPPRISDFRRRRLLLLGYQQ